MLRILETNKLNVKNEEIVIRIVIRWIETEKIRNKFLPGLLRAVRLEQLAIESMLTLENWEPGKNYVTV